VEAPSSTEASTKAADTRPVASSAPTEHYQRGKKSRDGLGLFYMGRELAHFMSHEGAPWLERSSRETEEKPAEVVAALSLRPTDVVADVGAGTGYFSFRIAPLVPQGKVVAVDIQPEMLDAIRKKQEKLGLNNLETRLSTEDNPQLAPNSIDVALFVDVYHELSKPREVMEQVAASLKPGGRVVLIEYRGEDPSVPIKELHKMTEAQAKKELAAVGLRWTETKDFLPWQHLMIFTK
jgi:ubiquinone/menaquinone biosynthesis C-methylase UbiE